MSEFKVGDKVIFIDSVYSDCKEVLKIDFIDRFDLMLSNKNKGIELNEICGWSVVIRHAKPTEVEAGFKEGSKEFDLYWYGQSLGEAIKAHELLGEELIEGGAAFIGNNSNIVQMVNDLGDDFPLENHISPNCKVEDV